MRNWTYSGAAWDQTEEFSVLAVLPLDVVDQAHLIADEALLRSGGVRAGEWSSEVVERHELVDDEPVPDGCVVVRMICQAKHA